MKKSIFPKIVLVVLLATGVGLMVAGGHNFGSGGASIGNLFGTTASHPSNPGSNSYAPDLTLSKIDGGNITLSDYRGKKAVILDFFATWCPNCRRDIPHESAFYGKYKDNVEIIGVNLQEGAGTVSSFANQNSIPFPIVLDPQGEASGLYSARYTNFHVLISKEGKVVGVVPGDIKESDFESLVS